MTKKSKTGELNSGTFYKITQKDGVSHDGIFISETDDFAYFKLKSGYNIGIAKENILSADAEGQVHAETADKNRKSESSHQTLHPTKDVKQELNPEILILHTGGTIASKVDYATGAVISKFTPEEMIELFPELKSIAAVDSKLIRNMWSDDMRPEHYNILAEEIEKASKIKSLKGIILTHGTDTLHYTASALSFIFESLRFPVVLVGSQRSSDRPSSDAGLNLLSAALFISKAQEHGLAGVFICMHESNDDRNCLILPPQNIRKLHSSRRDAFKCINCSPLARVNFERKELELLAAKHFHEEQGKERETKVKLFNPQIKVGIIRSRPGLLPEEIKVYEKFDGLILEGTGLGHFPIEQIDEETAPNREIFDELKKLASKKVVCMTTQTVFGRVNLNVYAPGRIMKDAGILGHNLDMITETAYIKLLWLLSNYSPEESKKLYAENLRGEISERSEKEEFL